MKKKLLLGVALVAVFALGGTTVYAARYIELPWTNNIYKVSNREDSASTVSVFDDGDNKCYLVNSSVNGTLAISCVKR